MQNTTVIQAIKSAYPDLPSQPRTLLTVRQFSDRHSAFTQGAIRNLIFLAESRKTSKGIITGNGLNIALARIGRKLLIDEAKFFSGLMNSKGGRNEFLQFNSRFSASESLILCTHAFGTLTVRKELDVIYLAACVMEVREEFHSVACYVLVAEAVAPAPANDTDGIHRKETDQSENSTEGSL
ncbi:MAG: hypothetical protein IPN95_28300 [Bacteroidetes bacterium]|nr:hypothetical protein [Bacteroidota bacterium]